MDGDRVPEGIVICHIRNLFYEQSLGFFFFEEHNDVLFVQEI